MLYEKILEISNNENLLPYNVINMLERSPLHQIFVRTGLTLMDDISSDRLAAFAHAENIVRGKYGDSLKQDEFEALTDFKDQLSMLV